jgi:predicted type IV restriction endonuclease
MALDLFESRLSDIMVNKPPLYNQITKIKKKIEDEEFIMSLKEEDMIKHVIYPIISNLGWDGSDILSEHRIVNGRIDFLLTNNNVPKVIIEAKKLDQDLEEHKEQLCYYLDITGAKFGLLSNGKDWWFYLPRFNYQWRLKKVYAIDINKERISTLYDQFNQLLNKESAISPNWGPIARKNIDKINDQSLMGLSDNKLMNLIENIKNIENQNYLDKRKLYDLQHEAFLRDLIEYY